MMRDACDVEAFVGSAVAQNWDVQHKTFDRITGFTRLTGLIHAFDDVALETGEGADVANAVPRIKIARWLTLRFVTLQKPRHEEFLRQRRQTNAASLPV